MQPIKALSAAAKIVPASIMTMIHTVPVEHLLIDTDFTMGQIAQMIGYSTSSRFAELFKKNTGILPIEYRKIARKDQ